MSLLKIKIENTHEDILVNRFSALLRFTANRLESKRGAEREEFLKKFWEAYEELGDAVEALEDSGVKQ